MEEKTAKNASETAQKPKKVVGRPFTSETAKQASISSTRAKRLRKEARHQILQKLTTELNLGDEVLLALKRHDDRYLGMIERATRLIGCHFDQSEDSIQNIKVDSKTESKSKVDSTIRFVLDEPTKE